MEKTLPQLFARARHLIAGATGLWVPTGVRLAWDDRPGCRPGQFCPGPEPTIRVSRGARRPQRVVVHEAAHWLHWRSARHGFRWCGVVEVERFAVAVTRLVDEAFCPSGPRGYPPDAPAEYREADAWCRGHSPAQVRRWLEYVICF